MIFRSWWARRSAPCLWEGSDRAARNLHGSGSTGLDEISGGVVTDSRGELTATLALPLGLEERRGVGIWLEGGIVHENKIKQA